MIGDLPSGDALYLPRTGETLADVARQITIAAVNERELAAYNDLPVDRVLSSAETIAIPKAWLKASVSVDQYGYAVASPLDVEVLGYGYQTSLTAPSNATARAPTAPRASNNTALWGALALAGIGAALLLRPQTKRRRTRARRR